ncbi:MAG: sulfurtransferase TusA family protein [Gammaproteobacteria bacterium]|nr:sulfurtransferase TusA family protein [Gammaproteobacteria bacterium]MDH5592468.1 sulfurtransferase TusA family protein [Gammaproteobacteria bacterium]
MSEYELDARRLLCPMPVIKTQNKVKELAVGDILSVICTDPGVLSDIPAWARINGHELVGSYENDTEITITIRVGS